ncbi:MAG: hypothetical protein KGL39_22355 [Patescibacteria group bacterium]|nr:hypothetical protein [Patescibacteria group bacterium]
MEQQRDRKWADTLKLDTPADIAKLPWGGCHYLDSELFELVDRFVRKQTDRRVQKAALDSMCRHGMGMDTVNNPTTDDELDAYLEEE